MQHASLIAVLVIVVPLSASSAQERTTIQIGERLRITAPQEGLVQRIGTLAAIEADTLVVKSRMTHHEKYAARVHSTSAQVAIRVFIPSITQLELVTGRESHWLKGIGVSVITGLVVGAGMGALAGAGDECSELPCGAGVGAIAGGIAGGLIGIPVGVIVGGLWRTDRWQEVSLDGLRISATRDLDGGVGLAIWFSR